MSHEREEGREGEERFLWRRLKMRERVAPISKLRGGGEFEKGAGSVCLSVSVARAHAGRGQTRMNLWRLLNIRGFQTCLQFTFAAREILLARTVMCFVVVGTGAAGQVVIAFINRRYRATCIYL